MIIAIDIGLVIRAACVAFAVVVALRYRTQTVAWAWCALWCILMFQRVVAWLHFSMDPPDPAMMNEQAFGFVYLADELLVPGTASLIGMLGSFTIFVLLDKDKEKNETIQMLTRKLQQEGHRC